MRVCVCVCVCVIIYNIWTVHIDKLHYQYE